MKINKLKVILILLIPIFLYSCQGARDMVQGKKRSKSADEFLVEKKNPLTMPPDFNKLPTPGQTEDEEIYPTKDSTDVNININSNNKFIQDYMKYLGAGLREYHKRYQHFNPELCIKEGFNIQHYKPNGGYKQWHNERDGHQAHQRALVFMTYLNDVPDGGGTEFVYYPEVKLEAKKGLSILWPTDFTHTHRGIISQHEKWIITGWFHHLGVVETRATIQEKIQGAR